MKYIKTWKAFKKLNEADTTTATATTPTAPTAPAPAPTAPVPPAIVLTDISKKQLEIIKKNNTVPYLEKGMGKTTPKNIEYIRLVQNILNIKQDGDFGDLTFKAVTAFQTNLKLKDGKIGLETWTALLKLVGISNKIVVIKDNINNNIINLDNESKKLVEEIKKTSNLPYLKKGIEKLKTNTTMNLIGYIKLVQSILKIKPTGIYDDITQKTVLDTQTKNNFQIKNGEMTPETWTALLKLINIKGIKINIVVIQ